MSVLLDAGAVLSFGGVDSASGMLTDIQSTFLRFMSNGSQKIVEASAAMAGALLAWQFVLMLIEIGISRHSIGKAAIGFLFAVLWYRVATNAVPVTQAFASWMGSLGSFLGDLDGDIMKNPSLFVSLAVKDGKAIKDQMDQLSLLTEAATLLPLFITWFFLWLCFLCLGAMAVFINIYAALKTMLGIALLPFIVEPRLSFLADAGIGLIRDAGLQLGAMSLAIGLSYGFLKNITLQPTATFQDAILLTGAVFTCAIVSGGAAFVKAAFGGLNRTANMLVSN
jgi:type IV secretory pathway TrbL component